MTTSTTGGASGAVSCYCREHRMNRPLDRQVSPFRVGLNSFGQWRLCPEDVSTPSAASGGQTNDNESE
jgi:hypothetical protein